MKITKHLSFITALLVLPVPCLNADENLFGNVLGAETLPQGHFDFYQTVTLRAGKDSGYYRGWDFDTEVEYGFTDRFQLGFGVVQHAFDIKGNDELDDRDGYEFGGLEITPKYRILSPFKDAIGLAFRMEAGYLFYDDVAGLPQEEYFVNPGIILQKNFLDDTLITVANVGVQWAWGKKPAEEYEREVALEGGLGVSYRVARNLFMGVEGRIRSEYPNFDLGFHEHTVVFAGPAIHYGAQKWWATLSYGYQVWGSEVDQVVDNKAYAEEATHEFRLKVGLNS